MRELKFRAFINGDYYYSTDEKFYMFWEGGKLHITYVSGLLEGTDEVFETISSGFILEQFTGLKDKKGLDIYEGDILEYAGNNRHYDRVCTVNWDYRKMRFSWGIWCPTGLMNTEVIGNIHENKDMLNKS